MFSKSNIVPTAATNDLPYPSMPDDLNDHISSINCYDKLRKNLYDEIKKINKCLYDLNCIEKKLIENLSTLISSNKSDENLSQLIQSWNELINESLKNRQDMAININRTMTEPLKKFQNAFQEMKNAIKRYEQLVSECNKCNQKLLELKRCDRTSNIIVKQNRYETLLRQAQNDCDTLRSTLERELPMFLEKRIKYFQPSLAAFICSGILYSGNNFAAITQSNLDLDESETDRTEKQTKLFKSIDNLSIVSS